MNDVLQFVGSMLGAGPGALTNPEDPLGGAIQGAVNTAAALAGTPGAGEALGGIFGSTAASGGLNAALGAGQSAAGAGAASAVQSALPAAIAASPTAVGMLSDVTPGSELVGAVGGPSSGIDAAFASAPETLGSNFGTEIGPGLFDVGGSAVSQGISSAVPEGASAIDSILGQFTDPKTLMSLGGLGLTALRGEQSLAGEDELKRAAASLDAQQAQLRSGAIPPGIQAGLKSAAEAAKASMRSMFASKGMSGSSSEIAALADIDTTIAFKGAELAQKLIATGIDEARLSTALYTSLMQQALERDQQLGNAIGSFATALAGGNPFAKAA